MRCKTTTFPEFRKVFKDQLDLAETINKSVSYVNNRMNLRKNWTDNDIRLIREEIERRKLSC